MQLTLRTKALIATALAVGAFVIFAPSTVTTVPAVEARSTPGEHAHLAGAAAQPPASRPLDRIANRVVAATSAATLFASHSWLPPPPPPPPPAPPVVQAPVAPTAPPLPFAYMGSFVADGGQAVYFVTREDRIYDLKAGDTVDNLYSFDGASANQLLFTYKPMKLQQTLAMGPHE